MSFHLFGWLIECIKLYTCIHEPHACFFYVIAGTMWKGKHSFPGSIYLEVKHSSIFSN